MGWMKGVFTDVEELNEKVLDIYSEGQIVSPWDAVDPITEHLAAAGWKTPTEMLAMRRDITELLRSITDTPQGEREIAYSNLVLHLAEAFKIDVADVMATDKANA